MGVLGFQSETLPGPKMTAGSGRQGALFFLTWGLEFGATLSWGWGWGWPLGWFKVLRPPPAHPFPYPERTHSQRQARHTGHLEPHDLGQALPPASLRCSLAVRSPSLSTVLSDKGGSCEFPCPGKDLFLFPWVSLKAQP